MISILLDFEDNYIANRLFYRWLTLAGRGTGLPRTFLKGGIPYVHY